MESKYNSYTGRWASKGGFLTVDAPTLEAAIMEMNIIKGSDPMTVVRLKDDVYVVNEDIDYVHIKVLSHYMLNSSETSMPDFGRVYPNEAIYPYKDQVIITSVPNSGYMFVNYTDEKGNEISTENEIKFVAKSDVTIYANFKKGRSNLPYTFNESQFLVTDDNYVSIKTTNEIVDNPDYIPTSKAVYSGLDTKVDKGDGDYLNAIEMITVNDQPVEVDEKVAKIDLTQDYLYEDEDIDFNKIF